MTPNKASSDHIFPVALLVITIVLAVGGGAFYWYHTPTGSNRSGDQRLGRSDLETVYTELGIQPLPSNVERQERVESRLAQLSREPCYRDAVVNLARALLNAGYPRQAATSLRSFVKRCGSAPEVLPLAFTGLERINDFSGALEVANELVEAVPASAAFRVWRALAYDRTGKFSQAILDYMNAIQLTGDPKRVGGDVLQMGSELRGPWSILRCD